MTASSRAFAIALLVSSLATVAQAADTIKGTAGLDNQTVMLAHGLGILHKTGRDVSIGFFAGPLSAPDEATIVKEGFLNAGGDAPYLVVKLSFPTGAKDVTKLAMCELDYFNYKGGIHQYQDMAPACGVVLLSGDLRAGGVVHGKLKGATKGDGGKGHTWDLEFTTTLRASRGR